MSIQELFHMVPPFTMTPPGGLCLLLLASCLIVPSLSVSTPRSGPDSKLRLQASPSVVYEGITSDVNLTCSFVHPPNSEFSTIISLILSKEDGMDKYSEVAAITEVSRDTVNVLDSLGGQVSGQLPATGLAYITYTWSAPGQQTVGSYRCEVHGMDGIGHPLVSSADVAIIEKEVDHDAYHDVILKKIKDLETTVNDQNEQLQDQKAQLDDQAMKLDNQTSKLDEVMSRLNSSQSALKAASTSFQGHDYFLTYLMWRNVHVFDSVCRLFGGYLAEIDDKAEYDFLKDFLQNFLRNTPQNVQQKGQVDQIFIGGTDEGKNGQWTFQTSGTAMTYFNWVPGQPGNSTWEECIGLWPDHDMAMDDWYCLNEDWQRFLCEVPN